MMTLLLCASAPVVAVTVHLDVSEKPELADWGNQAKELIEQWYQRTANLLPTEGFTEPTEIWLKIKDSDEGVAWTSGVRIVVASGWIEKHPEDIGCVHHELVHALQRYPWRRVPGWVFEGIADYLRWAIYEGKPLSWFPYRDKPKGYEGSYQITGGFFLWLESGPCPGIVKKLNTAIRRNTYKDAGFFEKETGRPIDQLWADYVKVRKDMAAAAKTSPNTSN